MRDAKRDLLDNPVEETDFVEGNGWGIELVRGSDQALAFLFYQNEGKQCAIRPDLTWQGKGFVPPKEDGVLKQVHFVNGIGAKLEPANCLLQEIDSLLSRCLDLADEYRFLLACFVMSTWLIDRLPVAPYVGLVGPQGSGKTMALKVLRLLCRRGLLTSDISSKGFYRACDRVTPTLLIDEAATAGQRRTLFHQLRSGTTRDVVALRENRSYRPYGARVLTWTELPNDDALNSRCIIIPMHETLRTDLLRPDNPEVLQAARMIASNLLRYRVSKFRILSIRRVPGIERLRSRARDLYEALALPIGEDPKACAHLLECLKHQQDMNREPLPSNQMAVIGALHKQIHVHSEQPTCLTLNLTKEVNQILAESGERSRLNPKGVGTVLKTFGFLKKRINQGWVILLDRAARKCIHELMSRYGVDAPSACLPSQELEESCEFCKAQRSEPAEVPGPAEPAGDFFAANAENNSLEESQNREEEKEIEDIKSGTESKEVGFLDLE